MADDSEATAGTFNVNDWVILVKQADGSWRPLEGMSDEDKAKVIDSTARAEPLVLKYSKPADREIIAVSVRAVWAVGERVEKIKTITKVA